MIWINELSACERHYTPRSSNRQIPGSMEIFYFTITAILCYVIADWALKRVEAIAGRRFENRTLIFFAMLLGFALVSFALIRNLAGA